MKILLIKPSKFLSYKHAPPLGLAYLASCLEKAGHQVKIIDSFKMESMGDNLAKELKNFNPEVVGISSSTREIYSAYSTANLAKSINPNCLIVLGGPHPTILPKEVMRECNNVDVIVRGEGEVTFIELLENLKNKRYENIKGITYRKENRIIKNPDRAIIQNLDSLPLPAYHLLSIGKYKTEKISLDFDTDKKTYSLGVISTSRGCPYNCIFCASRALWGKQWRARSAEKVVDEIRFLKDKYKIEILSIIDDTFTVDKKRNMEICELLKKEDVDIPWVCTTRVELFNKEMSSLFKKSGCFEIGFGIESGVQQTLDYLQKGFTIQQAKTAIKIAKKDGLRTESAFIIGVPGETKDMINQTINFANKLKLGITTFFLLTPFPGTRMYEMAREQNLILTKDWSKYTLANPVMKVPGFTSLELRVYLFKANLSDRVNRSKFWKLIGKTSDKDFN